MLHPHTRPSARRRIFTILNVLVLASLLLTQAALPAAAGVGTRTQSTGDIMPSRGAEAAPAQDYGLPPSPGTDGLDITLSEGSEQPQEAVTRTVTVGEPLSAEETAALLQRMPPLETDAADQVDFRLPEALVPPPSPETRIDSAFPPTATAPLSVEVVGGDLEVLRFAPEGEIRMAPFLQVTFNQPMAPLGTLEQIGAADVPVTITPQLPGVWKWLGTKTLTFEYKGETGDPAVDRFPMATAYSVEIPEGTTSATGGVLQQAVRWEFTTPAPTVRLSHPSYGPQPRDPLFFVGFDQLIDPAAVLNTIQVAANGEAVDVRLAAAEEVAEDPTVTSLAKQAGDGRWLAFRATEELPYDATINVNIGPNTPSAEGPLVTPSVQSYTFQTYGALRVVDARCAWGGDLCPPGSPFELQFTNSIDAKVFDPAWITTAPTIAGMTVNVYGNIVQVMGATAGSTSYSLTVNGVIQDIFGQTLGADESFTFKTDQAYQLLTGPYQGLVTVDPGGDPTFSVFSRNYRRLHVRIYAVTPNDWKAWQAYQRDYWSDAPPAIPGELVLEKNIEPGGEPDALVQTNIDLLPVLPDSGFGHLIVIVDIPKPLFGERDHSNVQSWVQVTNLAVDALADQDELLAWTTDLRDGMPLADVTVELYGTKAEGMTGPDATVNLPLSDSNGYLLVATQGDDVAILPHYVWDYYGDSGWRKQDVANELRWYVFDDRQMYRPGEEVHFKGWLRRFDTTPTGDISLLGDSAPSVRYQIMDPMGNSVAEDVVDLNALNGFDFAITLPENANLGYFNVYFTANGIGNVGPTDNYYQFQVQEFRRPEFEVKAQPEGMGPWFVGADALVSVNASYYAGGALPSAEATWTVNASPASYAPPNWDDFIFGVWRPWWISYYDYGYSDMAYGDIFYTAEGEQQGPPSNQLVGVTDATGTHYLRMNFNRADEPRPYSVRAEAVVMDVNRQAWASSTNLLVHPSALYVGLRSNQVFVEAGDPLNFEVIVTDVDGNAVAETPVQVHSARQEYVWKDGRYLQQDAEVQDCEVLSASEPVTCSFDTTIGGTYRVWAEVRDANERLNRTELTRWVSGGTSKAARTLSQEEAQIIPDKESYAAGDVAELLVQSPFSPAEGLLSVARNGFLTTERFTITDTTAILRVPIEESYVPNVVVQVDLTGAAVRVDDKGDPMPDAPLRPAFATGQLSLPVPPVNRTLTLAIAPEETALAPGKETAIDLVATDASGEPVAGAEIAVVVVDEAILALTGYSIPNPLLSFYREVGAGLDSTYTRNNVVLIDPATMAEALVGGRGGGGGMGGGDAVMSAAMPEAESDMAMPAAAPMATEMPMMESAGMATKEESAQPTTAIDVRSNFNPLAVFAPAVTTDAAGKARVEFQMPDNLTRYRVMVVAATERDFGSAEANITVRLPLMVRPSAPRFLNFGDTFAFPMVLQNQTDAPLSVRVAMTTANIGLDSPLGQLVEVPANDRVEVRFAASTLRAGTGRFQVAAAAGDFADGISGELPVYTPATTEAFAVYGTVDEGAVAQPLQTPTDVIPQFGGLEIGTSSTALSALTDAVLYLYKYPFECSEQVASRLLGISALTDVLSAFKADGLPDPVTLDGVVDADVARLVAMQNMEGGWPMWEKGKESLPYNSIYVAHALQVARSKDYAVPEETLSLALNYLRNIEEYYPNWYSAVTRHTLSAYAVYVRDLMGDTDAAKARNLLNSMPLDTQSLEAIGWLWQVLSGDPASAAEVEAIRVHVNNSAVETAGAANFFTSYGDQEWVLLHSNRRTDAILLDALINDQPESDLIAKLVNGLLANRTAGRWHNTQENVWVLLALDRYFNTYENVEPDFIARVWLGDTYVAEHPYQGYTTDAYQTLVPMTFLVGSSPDIAAAPETTDIIIAKDGAGRLYYRLALSYAPTDLNLEALDMGFVVARTYEAVDDPADVQRDADGTWRMKAGARVRIRLQMVADNRRYHVALVDPLPAGLEAINPALAVSESIPESDPSLQPYGWWWYGTWYEHQNLRDNRAEAFTSLLWDGVYDYTYVARATTPGTYVVPPTKAEEMYSPEVFGRSASDKVIVE